MFYPRTITQTEETPTHAQRWHKARRRRSQGQPQPLVHGRFSPRLSAIVHALVSVWAIRSFLMEYARHQKRQELATLSASSSITTHKPSFTIHPGEPGSRVVRRLLGIVPDLLFFRNAKGYVRNPQSTDATDYAYGTDHAILEGRYASNAWRVNRVQVYAPPGMAEAFQWPEVEQVHDRLLQIHDDALDTLAKAQDRGVAQLRKEEAFSPKGEVLLPVNCGQELYDVLEITDSRAGISAAQRRVVGTSVEYLHSQRSKYVQRLQLGGV